MRLKQGVKINGIKPETILAICIADSVYKSYGIECVITSITEGKHRSGSLHYVGFAFDLRSRDILHNIINEVVKELREALGVEFDVVLESDHIHIEFQPKA